MKDKKPDMESEIRFTEIAEQLRMLKTKQYKTEEKYFQLKTEVSCLARQGHKITVSALCNQHAEVEFQCVLCGFKYFVDADNLNEKERKMDNGLRY